MNLSSRLFTCLLIGTLAACSHPLRIVGTGDILSFSGERDCIYEDFSEYTGDGQPCPNWVAGDYQESYLAIPIFGADFLRWEGCPNPMGPVCDFDVPAEIVDASWGQEAPPLTAHFGDFYQFHTFSHRVIDAVYDEQRDLLVTLGDDNQLHVLNVFTRESTSLSLAVAGHAVAISADGTQAAVGHDGFVSHIDMSTLSVIDLLPVPTEVFDIEIPGNGFIYTSPEGLSRTRASVVEIATGAISEFPLMGGNYRIKTHPDLDAIYSTNWGLTSEVLTRYDITGGLPVRERSLFHSGNSLLCNDLWFSDDGKKLFGPCNDVFYASDDPVMDMTLAATLPIDNQGFFVNRGISQQGSELLVTAPYPRNEIRVFDYPSLTETDRFTLPDFWPDFLNFELGANFVFHRSDGGHVVIAEVLESTSGTHGVAIRHSSAEPSNARPTAVADAKRFAEVGEELELNGQRSSDPELNWLSYAWSIVSQPPGSSAVITSDLSVRAHFTPDLPGEYQMQLVVSDGEKDSEPTTFTITAQDATQLALHVLNIEVVETQYSAILDSVVMTSFDSTLRLLDIHTGVLSEIALPSVPSSLSLTPDGQFAAIEHSDSSAASIFDLEDGTLIATLNIPYAIRQIVLGTDGFLYVLPNEQYNVSLQAINLFSGRVVTSTGDFIFPWGDAALHPSGNAIYDVVSNEFVRVYDVSGEVPHIPSEPIIHGGNRNQCSEVFLLGDGEQLLLDCGLLLNTASDGAAQVSYGSTLILEEERFGGNYVIQTRIASAAANDTTIALTQEQRVYRPPVFGAIALSDRFYLFDRATRTPVGEVNLPAIPVGNSIVPSEARQVFYDSTGEKLVVFIQPEYDAAVQNTIAIWVRDAIP